MTYPEQDAFFERFAKETDRACGVLGAALLEEYLKKIFEKRLHVPDKKLFAVQGPLGSFSAKINMAYSLGWIDADMKADLDTVRGIRNDFAHSWDHELDFKDQSISDRTHNLCSAAAFLEGITAKDNRKRFSDAVLNNVREKFSTPRWRFAIAIEFIVQLLNDLAVQNTSSYTGPSIKTESFETGMNMMMGVKFKGTATFLPSTAQR
jgi:DNA-binding MltR family transcriptional regulator